MAQFFKAKPNRSKRMAAKMSLQVTQLDHLGAGIGHQDGKIIFVPGALPGESASIQVIEQKKRHARAKLLEVMTPSPDRVLPICAHYEQCGGCDLQHLDINKQRQHKQNALVELMAKLSNAHSESLSPAIIGSPWSYRRRARLATYYDKGTKQTTLGFRAQASKQVIKIEQCPVLATPLSKLILPLSELLNRLAGKKALGHVELIEADNGLFCVIRTTKEFSAEDVEKLKEFALHHQVKLIVQGNESDLTLIGHELKLLTNGDDELPHYGLNNEVKLSFTPGNFVQVNAQANQAMVNQAVDWLSVKNDERVLDLFCGVGNFSLPLAKKGGEVIGVEGVPEMVQQARLNAKLSDLDNVSFFHTDLSADLSKEAWLGKVDKLLLDPARAGAFESLQWLKKMKPKAIVYVSCNPASLARDSEPLLKHGYKLVKLGLIDMFPQTHHIEAMALFELDKR